MWKCSDCGAICKADVCEKCGLRKEETLFGDDYFDDEDFIEPLELPDPEEKMKKHMLKAKEEVKREKRVAKLEKKLDKAKKTKPGFAHEAPTKEKNKKPLAVILGVLLCVVVAVSIVTSVILVKNKMTADKVNQELKTKISVLEGDLEAAKSGYEQVNSQADSKNSENNDLRSEKERLEAENTELRDENEQLNERIDELNTEVSDLTSKLGAVQSENSSLRGLRDKVKVVEYNGTYHTYGCSAISSGKYWIYDRDQVVGNSKYKKCDVCH